MMNASPVVDPVGQTLGAVAVMRDITTLRRLEQAKSMFVSMVAHEIRNPLAAIQGYLNVILRGLTGSDAERHRQMLDRAVLRTKALRTMLSELMDVTAMQTGRFSLRRTPFLVKTAVDKAVEECRERATAKHIALTADYGGYAEFLKVLADEEALRSIFTNVVDNAIKYTPEKGRVEVRVEPEGRSVKVAVKDTGIGMTSEERDHVFEEFFRARNEHTIDIPGTGLGLTIVKRLVDMHQGSITVESSPGRGSTFRICLPVYEAETAS